MKFTLKAAELGLRDSRTRLPFRYGAATLTYCPQARLEVEIETAGGTRSRGWSGDCLPPSWFDKSPEKSYARQIEEMITAIETAAQVWQAVEANATLQEGWSACLAATYARGAKAGWPELLSGFGCAMVERAVLDALCRAEETSFFQAASSGLFGFDPGVVHKELASCNFSDWLPRRPRERIFVRHTVGLADPIVADDLRNDERPNDGLPVHLSQCIERYDLRYFKVKTRNNETADLERLRRIARTIEAIRGDDYALTLDGNEQYRTVDQLQACIDAMRRDPALQTLWGAILCIEQPLARAVALNAENADALRSLSAIKPIIIDESDGDLNAYARAAACGYRGVSSKSCKGAIKSLLNAGLTWLWNDRGAKSDFLMTAEDLCCVGVAPLQGDLTLAATLGLSHCERNGHHYHPGLSYMPSEAQAAAVSEHPDLYEWVQGFVAPQVRAGAFEIASLQHSGFGFAPAPGGDIWTPAGEFEPDVNA